MAAQDFLPLQAGNSWTYKDKDGSSFTITAGTPLMNKEDAFFPVRGLAPGRLLLRSTNEKTLESLNGETDERLTVLAFDGREVTTEIGGCKQTVRAEEKRVAYNGPAGYFGSALRLVYGPPQGCADIGITEELYLENLGLVRRTITSFVGPRTFDLVSAKVGKLSVSNAAAVAVELSVEGSTAKFRIASYNGPVRFEFPSAQRYNLIIRDEAGSVVFDWMADKRFAQVVATETFQGERLYEIGGLPIESLTPGNYQVEAYLTTREQTPQIAASAPLQIPVP